MAYSAGLFDKLYRNTGTHNTPVLVEIDIVEDVKIPDERNEITGKLRANDHEAVLTGQRKLGFEFKLATNPTNANWEALQSAYLNHTTVELFAFYHYVDNAGQPGAGSKAIRAICEVVAFPMEQPLEDLDSGDVVCKPSLNADYAPSIYTVA